MPSVGVFPTLPLLAGALCGALTSARFESYVWLLPLLATLAWAAWLWLRPRLTLVFAAGGYLLAGLVLAGDARIAALHTPLRQVLDRELGGFAIDTHGPGARHDPILARGRILEDASRADDVTALRVAVRAIHLKSEWRAAAGAVTMSVGGLAAAEPAGEWLAGREIEMPVTFRRPARYLNEGVSDFEHALALDGTTLFGSTKSALVIDVLARGTWREEQAARVRAHVRRSIDRWVAPHDPISAAIVTAVLIGDRTGLPDDVRLRLQAAGTYHVIAISGGNIAIVAAVTLVVLLLCGVSGRPAALLTILVLAGYAAIVSAGASVWRATLMAALYLAARILDHRSPPWQAMALAASLVICAQPLQVRDVGFILTFAATGALLEAARRLNARRVASGSPSVASGFRRKLGFWLTASIAASVAAELALLPVSAWTFSRVTGAGLLLNLLAVPLMALAQTGGMCVAAFDRIEAIARLSGWIAHVAASALVSSARLVDEAPWMTTRVPPPAILLIATYYVGLGIALAGRGRLRIAGIVSLLAAAFAIVTGIPVPRWWKADAATLRLSVFDVAQGEALLLRFPDASSMLVDAGGIPFGGSFDIGGRVLAPALWARGVRSLDTLVLTHGDPDHIGGARSVVGDFVPGEVWEGIPVPRHASLQETIRFAQQHYARVKQKRAGDEFTKGRVRIRVLHPPPPDWERQRVRNDDSIVMEVLYGSVAVLLTGDVSAAVERTLLPLLTPARTRILKVAHHGSRTSTSPERLGHWRPQIAIISAGRGNTFGHPAPDVIQRLEAVGATIYRTDLHGQITIETDGQSVGIETYVGGTR